MDSVNSNGTHRPQRVQAIAIWPSVDGDARIFSRSSRGTSIKRSSNTDVADESAGAEGLLAVPADP